MRPSTTNGGYIIMGKENWDYDARLIPTDDNTIPHPACIFIREEVEGGQSIQFVPARITGITELGEVSEFNVAMGKATRDLTGTAVFNPVNITPSDLKYFGLKVHSLPDTVLANKREINVKRLLG